MTRQVKHRPQDNRFHGARTETPKLSIMHAFETAVLLMEQAGTSEEDIMKYVHLVHMGWIRDGEFAPEYLEMARLVEQERQKEEADAARIQALRDSVNTNIISSHRA